MAGPDPLDEIKQIHSFVTHPGFDLYLGILGKMKDKCVRFMIESVNNQSPDYLMAQAQARAITDIEAITNSIRNVKLSDCQTGSKVGRAGSPIDVL